MSRHKENKNHIQSNDISNKDFNPLTIIEKRMNGIEIHI